MRTAVGGVLTVLAGPVAQIPSDPLFTVVSRADSATPLRIDTTLGSVLHLIAARYHIAAPGRAYAVAVCSTYVPLLIVATFGQTSMSSVTDDVRLPLLYDWNTAFLMVVSFPSIVVLTLTDQVVLSSALHRVQQDGVLLVTETAGASLTGQWERRFRIVNLAAAVVGVTVGLILVFFNYTAYSPAQVGYWIAADSQLLASGYVFLWCIFLFYSVIPMYVLRSIAISLFLRSLVRHSTFQMLPFHPDRCGGLRPVGRLGLRCQYALSILGLNIVSLTAISMAYLSVPSSLYALIVAAAIAYVLLGPVVFIGPLLPFRSGMLRTKAELLSEVAARLRVELQRLRRQLPDGDISRQDEELLDRLRKLGAVIDELPVWPFDAGTLRKFVTAYIIPIASAVAYPLIEFVLVRVLPSTGP